MPPTFYDRIKALAKVFREIAGVVYTKASAMTRLRQFLRDQSGASSIEYGLIAAGISVVIIATVNAIGSTLNAKFDYISQQLK